MSTDSKFAPRTLTDSEYVRELFAPEVSAAILVRNRSTGHTVQTIAKAKTIANPDFQSWLAGQSTSDYDVFMIMNPIKDGTISRTKVDIKGIRHVYLEVDRNGEQALQRIRNSNEVPAPNYVLDTSPGRHHVVWKVSGFSQEESESLLHNLANKFGGDLAATDSRRVLRLPGFANHKLPEQFIVQTRRVRDAVYTLRDFTIEENSLEVPRPFVDAHKRSRTIPSGHKSQSEADWAYAKRTLARGDSSEEIIRRIADSRAHDKADSNYYARRTVTKAQADLCRGRTAVETPDSQRMDAR
jgi:hypothetical protein